MCQIFEDFLPGPRFVEIVKIRGDGLFAHRIEPDRRERWPDEKSNSWYASAAEKSMIPLRAAGLQMNRIAKTAVDPRRELTLFNIGTLYEQS